MISSWAAMCLPLEVPEKKSYLNTSYEGFRNVGRGISNLSTINFYTY